MIRADVTRDDRSLLLEIEVTPGRANRARINRAPVTKTREILGILRTVVFAPEDLALVKGDPVSGAASSMTCSCNATHVWQARAPTTTASCANAMPTEIVWSGTAHQPRGGGAAPLRPWDEQLSRLGAEIITARRELTAALAPSRLRPIRTRPRIGPIGLRYRSVIDDVEAPDVTAALLSEIDSARKEELDRGITLVGPTAMMWT